MNAHSRVLRRALQLCLFVGMLLGLTLLRPAPVAHAATITVNSLADTSGGTQCTLRNAITATNTNTATGGCIAGTAGAADKINFSVSGTIHLSSALPDISQDLKIDSTGQSIIVSGENKYLVFYVDYGVTLNLNAITVANGWSNEAGGIVDRGAVNVTNSTFSNNGSQKAGGGIRSDIGTVTLTNCTFSGNSAGDRGGGIYNSGGTVTLTNCTFAGNSATNSGGGIYNDGGDVTIRNTIIANSGSGNCGGTITADSHNLADDNSCGSATQKTTVEIALGSLANNGGPTQTMALGANSAAINLGNAATCAASVGSPNFGAGGLDQRGMDRRSGFCDSGAFEAQPASNTITGGSNQSAVITTAFAAALQVTVQDANNNLLGGAVVTYTVPASGASATLGSNTATTNASGVASVTATANGTAGGPYNVAANAAGLSAVNFSLTNLKADTTSSITNSGALGTATVVGQSYAVNFSVSVTPPGGGTPTGNVIVSDGTNNCTGTVSAGTCNLTSMTPGNKTITATYQGDGNYNASPASSSVSHTVLFVTCLPLILR